MIRTSSVIAVVAILVSLCLHFMGLTFISTEPEGGSGQEAIAETVALGNAFEDVAESVSEPVEPEQAQVPEPQSAPNVTDIPTSEALVASSNPQTTVTPEADRSASPDIEEAEPFRAERADTPAPETIEPTGSADQANTDPEQTQPVETEQVTEAPTGSPEAETEISDPVAPEEPETDPSGSEAVAALTVPVVPVLPVTPSPEPAAIPVVPSQPEVIEPEPPETTEALSEPSEGEDTEGTELAVTSSPRPRVPDRQPVEDTAGVQDGTADEVDSLFDPSRRVESPITVFQRDGVDLFSGQNRSSQSGNRGFAGSGGTGNSDQTNYKGRVLVHLNRFANTRVSARGWVRVTMTINGDGSLGSIAVVDSSGSEEIERLAITTARRAAPFPKPPSGLARTLTFPYSSDQ